MKEQIKSQTSRLNARAHVPAAGKARSMIEKLKGVTHVCHAKVDQSACT